MPATRAVKLAALVALVATPAVVAQPPSNRPAQSGAQPPAGLPLPPGYRPRTQQPQTPPQPQAQPQRPPTAPAAAPAAVPSGAGSGGRIMYFHKPAGSTTATGTEGITGAEGAAPAPVPTAAPITAAPVVPAYLPPPPPASRYLPPDPVPVAAPVVYQPESVKDARQDDPPSVSKKQETKIVPVDPKFIQLPPRENIFMVYNDLELEKAIMERIRQDLKSQVDPMTGKDKYNPEAERFLVFPALPAVSPPDVPYRPKTLTYAPSKVIVEPGYVVHRRLHFEEKNAERAGWDLGPLSTLVGAGYFYRDVVLWPQSLVSGCVTGFWSTNVGKCLPGSPSPYYLYPVGLTITGTAAETAVITGAAFLFP